MNPEQIHLSNRSGMTCVMGFDPVTGEPLEPTVGIGHSPTSPFADGDDAPFDYLDPEALSPTDNGEAMIVEATHELYPDLDQILDFAIATYGDEITQMYDDAIENDDWATVHNFLESWSEEFRETQTSASHEEVNQELDQLAEAEPEGLETAFELLQQAEQTDNPIESEMLQMASAFHKGDISANDAIQQMLNKYPLEQLIPLYNHLTK